MGKHHSAVMLQTEGGPTLPASNSPPVTRGQISPAREGGDKEVLMTEAQLKANRENAKLSHGPRTPEGKKRSSLNAFRHGLTGQIVVHTPEDQEAFKKHCDAIREALDPEGALETDLAQAIAEDRWRLNRARALENAIFALGQSEHLPPDGSYSELDAALAQAQVWTDHAHHLNLLTTYENRIRRSVEKNMAEFRALQRERKFAPIEAEMEHFLAARSKAKDDDPACDPPPESAGSSPAHEGEDSAGFSPARQGGDQPVGFVFSNPAAPNKISPNPSRDQRERSSSQRPGRVPETLAEARETKEANPPLPTRQVTMEDVYDIIGWHPNR
jgi:hypothetical protein